MTHSLSLENYLSLVLSHHKQELQGPLWSCCHQGCPCRRTSVPLTEGLGWSPGLVDPVLWLKWKLMGPKVPW